MSQRRKLGITQELWKPAQPRRLWSGNGYSKVRPSHELRKQAENKDGTDWVEPARIPVHVTSLATNAPSHNGDRDDSI
jgi:hypothetical protein